MKRFLPLGAAILLASLAAFDSAVHAAEPVVIDLATRTWQGIPGLERTAKGRVFVSWFTGGAKEPEPLNTVVLSHSDDGGKTFSAPKAMALPLDDGTRCYDPCLWIDPQGRLWYLFNRSVKDSTRHGVYARICDDPDATPPVWGPEFRVGFESPFSFRMNKPIVLSTGEWIMPVVHALEPLAAWAGFDPKQVQGVAISTDEGKTWKLHGAVKTPQAGLENMVVELEDGRLWMLIRTGKVLWESYSSDKGRTWSEGSPTTIATPHSRFFIRRLASGKLLLVNHFKFTGRSHLTAQLSTDDGKTWNDGLVLDERGGPNFPNGVPGGVSYPDGVQDRYGLIWITYDRDRNGQGEILLARFKEEDVAAGRDVSGAVSLKQVVSKLDKPSLVPANWNPKAAADKVMAGLVKVTAPEVKGAHGSKLTMIGDRAYVATLADNTAAGETHDRDSIYSALSVVNLRTMTVEAFLTTAKSGQAFTNETLPRGACYASGTLLLNDHTLRCFFCSEQPGRGQSQMYYRDFDLRTRAFANDVHRVKLKTSGGVFDLQPQHLHADAAKHGFTQPAKDYSLELLDTFKKFDGRTYAVLNSYVNALNALTVFNEAGHTLEVVGHYNEPQSQRLCESAVNRLPDGTWMAICRSDVGNYHFTTSKDGKTWSIGQERPIVPNGVNSKPTFDTFGGVYYLGWQEKTKIQGVNRSVFNVDVSKDCVRWERKYRFESTQTFQYPAFAEHDGAVWLTVSQAREGGGGPDCIMFGKLEDLPKSKPAVKVTQELLNSIHVTPKLIFDPFPTYAEKYLPFAMAASMESTKKGRLWTCWAGGQDGPNAYLLASYSDDQGRSWRDPVFVIDPQAHGLKMGTRLGSFWCDPKGRLWLFFHQSVGMFDGSCSNWFVRCDDPDAEKPVWTEPVSIGFGASLNKPIVRTNGEWILPVSLWERWHVDKPFADCYRELDAVRGANVFVSNDEGGHWRYRGGNIFKDSCFNEHSVVEKQDGTLWMLSRCMKEIAQSFSTDGGRTWQPQTTFFPHVNSKAVFRRLQSGNLLIVRHGTVFDTPPKDGTQQTEEWNWGKGRSHLTALLSTDDGKTWPGRLLLDERHPVSYPDIAQTPAGDIYVHYDRDRGGAAEILFARFREEDVQAGRLVSRDSALKNLVKSRQLGMNRGGAKPASPPITNSIGIQLVPIEPGTFTMGQDGPPMEDYLRQKRFGEMSKDFDRIDFDEKPAHAVTISRPFLIGVTEVTVGQYRQFDPGFRQGDPKSKPADDDAASGVSWEKAVAFCEWLSQKEGKPYRLPTEAEWEYACRAGTMTLFHTGDRLPDGHQKWFGEDNYRGVYFPPGPMPREYDWRHAGKAPAKGLQQGQILGLDHPEEESRAGGAGSLRVAQKTPNAWGLHDMHGNVAEWCLDWYGPYEAGPQTDPLGRVAGDCRVFRGGFHSSMIRFLRSANRGSWVANSASPRVGFRVVQGALPDGKSLPQAPPPQNAEGVSQAVPKLQPVDPGTPFFAGPQPFVRIPDSAVGPVFISQNHSPSITECPNGDLLAVWFSTLGETDLTTANAGSRLRFGAQEWEPASSFWDAQDVNDHAPKVWWDGDQTIYHIVEARQHGELLIRRSTDNGATWSQAEVMRPHGESSSNPIRTEAGVIAIPFDEAGLSISRDNGKTWTETGRQRRGSEAIMPGGKGPFMAGIHGPIVELTDGRLMAFGRISAGQADQEKFQFKMPVSHSGDLGDTWEWGISEFPVVSNTQRPAMLRLKEGPILLCSFTDEARTPFKERTGLVFKSSGGDYKGTGLYAAVSYDEGKTWPDRRLVAKDGVTNADIGGYLALTQTRDGRIQLITSKDHYVFNLAWIKAQPPAPAK